MINWWMKLRDVSIFFIMVFVLIFVGTAVIQYLEGWDFHTAFYHNCIQITSLGTGDTFVETQGGRTFTAVYSVFSISLFFIGVSIIAMPGALELTELEKIRFPRLST